MAVDRIAPSGSTGGDGTGGGDAGAGDVGGDGGVGGDDGTGGGNGGVRGWKSHAVERGSHQPATHTPLAAFVAAHGVPSGMKLSS